MYNQRSYAFSYANMTAYIGPITCRHDQLLSYYFDRYYILIVTVYAHYIYAFADILSLAAEQYGLSARIVAE